MKISKYLQLYQSILFLNGYINRKIFTHLDLTKTKVAIDGGILNLNKMGIKPDVCIGDGDSYQNYSNTKNYLLNENPDLSDFEKGLNYLIEKNLLPTMIIGINGGELDHIYGNLEIIKKYENKLKNGQINILFLDSYYAHDKLGYKLGMLLPQGTNLVEFTTINNLISFFLKPLSRINSKGLLYELNNFSLKKSNIIPIRNANNQKEVYLKIEKEGIISIFDVSNEILQKN